MGNSGEKQKRVVLTVWVFGDESNAYVKFNWIRAAPAHFEASNLWKATKHPKERTPKEEGYQTIHTHTSTELEQGQALGLPHCPHKRETKHARPGVLHWAYV